MNVLALELSTGRGSIAWREDQKEPCAWDFPNDRRHSGLFFENLQRCLNRFAKPDLIVVGLGPGSYAGVRIAISAAIGLHAATGATLAGLSSLCALATEAPDYVAIGDARRQTFYFARVRAGRCEEGPALFAEEELRARLKQSQAPVYAPEALRGFEQAIVALPCASLLAKLALHSEITLTPPPLEPIYLREPHITQPRKAPAISA